MRHYGTTSARRIIQYLAFDFKRRLLRRGWGEKRAARYTKEWERRQVRRLPNGW